MDHGSLEIWRSQSRPGKNYFKGASRSIYRTNINLCSFRDGRSLEWIEIATNTYLIRVSTNLFNVLKIYQEQDSVLERL